MQCSTPAGSSSAPTARSRRRRQHHGLPQVTFPSHFKAQVVEADPLEQETITLSHGAAEDSAAPHTVDGPRVIDFGIARALHAVSGNGFRTSTGAVIGSPGFMSPEQVRGLEVGPQSDVFSLGTVLAYAATGRPPFGSHSIGMHAQLFRVSEEEPDLEGVPECVLGLVRQCLEKAPEKRPTPMDLVARTTPAGQVRPWLPGEILEQLGRRAAWLLDLDPQGSPSSAPMDTRPDVPVEAPLNARADGQRDTPVSAHVVVQPDVPAIVPVGAPTSGAPSTQPSTPPVRSRFKRARLLGAIVGVRLSPSEC